MCKILLYGGAFNPFHIAHAVLARTAQEELNCDKVIFLPSGNPPHKTDLLDANHRFNMIQILCLTSANTSWEVSDFDIKKEGKCFSLETVRHFHKTGNDIYWLVGEDQFKSFNSWHKPLEILDLCTLVVACRNSSDVVKLIREQIIKNGWVTIPNIEKKIIGIQNKIIDISSTEIRQRIKENKPISFLVPPAIDSYIKTWDLYR